MIDSSDRDRFDEAYEELRFLLDASNSESVPVVVLANKMDLPHSAGCTEIAEALKLKNMTSR